MVHDLKCVSRLPVVRISLYPRNSPIYSTPIQYLHLLAHSVVVLQGIHRASRLIGKVGFPRKERQ